MGTLAPTLGTVGDVALGVGKLFTTRPEKGVVRLVRVVPDSMLFCIRPRTVAHSVTLIGQLYEEL